MIDKSRTMVSCIGKMATTTRDLECGVGLIPEGTVVKIVESSPHGMDIMTERCSHCGVALKMRGVGRTYLTLIEDPNAAPLEYRIRVERSWAYFGDGEGDEVHGMTFDTLAEARKALKEHGWRHRYRGEYDRGDSLKESGKHAYIDEVTLSEISEGDERQ